MGTVLPMKDAHVANVAETCDERQFRIFIHDLILW